MNYEEEIRSGKLEVSNESAIPSMSINETKFIAKGKDRYLIVFVDMVKSTNTLRTIDGNMDEVTKFFEDFHQKTIRSFRERFGNSFKFKMLGDGLLFFSEKKTRGMKNFSSFLLDKTDEQNSREFHNSLKSSALNVRTIAGYGTLIEVDVGLDNKWTDYYGVAINDIVHASKDMGAKFKWIKES